MSQDHRLQEQRFELKYLVNEAVTPRMRDFLSSHLELDDYAAGRADWSYPVHSLYLDSDDLKTHHAYVNGTKDRFRLRLRYYDDQPDTPVFFEVKARVDNCILKRRCPVRRETVPSVVAGHLPAPEQLLSGEPRHWAALQRFNLLLHQLQACPKAHTSYRREAWVRPNDNSVRITFDRDIRIEPHFKAKPVVAMTRPARLFPEFVVLEIKFTTRFPNWLKEMVRHFNLTQSASAKYSGGVSLLGERRFQSAGQPFDPSAPVGGATVQQGCRRAGV
jgi:SPX domain protein involved in polyphosphate accumulation